MKDGHLFQKGAFVCLTVWLLWGMGHDAEAQDTTQAQIPKRSQSQASKGAHAFSPFSLSGGFLTGLTVSAEGLYFDPLWVEPQVMLGNKIGLGLRYEVSLPSTSETSSSGCVRTSNSVFNIFHIFSAQGDFFLVNNYPHRMSTGLGMGVYYNEEAGETSFGVAPRMRFQWYVMELGLAVHLSAKTFVVAQLGLQLYGKR